MDPLEAHLQRQIEHSRDFFWHRIRWKAVSGQLRERRFELTDVGAGIGLVGEYLARQHPESTYHFVEPLPSLVAELESRFGPQANANQVKSYAGSRYVTLLDVLEHIEDDRAFLGDLVAKMEPGATLILTVPALQRLWSPWDVALGHFRRYDKASIVRVFAGLPVELREVSYLFPEMLPAAVARRRLRPAGAGAQAAQSAEFPDLSPTVNRLLYAVGSATSRLRRLWPTGTSVLAIADRV